MTFALTKEEGEHAIGESVKVSPIQIGSKNSDSRNEINATRESLAGETVTEVRKDLGVFVDVGIPDKEIVVSLDVLPELKELWPKKGDNLYIKLRC